MRPVLLDTHAFLWFVFDDPRLSSRAAEIIEDPANRKLLSMASLWEIVIKAQIGKLSLGMETGEFLGRFVRDRQVEIVPVLLEHLVEYGRLELHHRDPFDRLLIAQARIVGAPIVTADRNFACYDVTAIW